MTNQSFCSYLTTKIICSISVITDWVKLEAFILGLVAVSDKTDWGWCTQSRLNQHCNDTVITQ